MPLSPIEIQSRAHPYRVEFCADVDAALAPLIAGPSSWFLVDRNVARLYASALRGVPAARLHLVDAVEEHKAYERLVPVFDWLIEGGCRRDHRLVVVGGGITQDIGCFIASVLFRGLTWSLVPTTLLAQCDSCIGSKSSLNIGRFKNQLGTFYPPHEVRLTTGFLSTLSRRDLHSGIGEAIKLHFVEGEAALAELRRQLADLDAHPERMGGIVEASLRIKQRFIEVDEFDRGVRNQLNFGHTFGHAFESATEYAIEHGIGVTLGVACACYFAERLGLSEPGSFEELRGWIAPYFGGHEQTLRRADPARILAAMRHDKKNQGDRVTFFLPRRPGAVERHPLDLPTVASLLPEAIAALGSGPHPPSGVLP